MGCADRGFGIENRPERTVFKFENASESALMLDKEVVFLGEF